MSIFLYAWGIISLILFISFVLIDLSYKDITAKVLGWNIFDAIVWGLGIVVGIPFLLAISPICTIILLVWWLYKNFFEF